MDQKLIYSWTDLERDVQGLALKIALTGWRPDYIVGITRGGCVPAVMLSHLLNTPMWALKVSLRDSQDCESNCWMAEEAYGVNELKNILIVDDINDTGATFEWIQKDWQISCYPAEPKWQSVWNHNVKFAVLHNNESSNFKSVDFALNHINKLENDVWIEYPWERS